MGGVGQEKRRQSSQEKQREKDPQFPQVDARQRVTYVQVKARLSLTGWRQGGGNMRGLDDRKGKKSCDFLKQETMGRVINDLKKDS